MLWPDVHPVSLPVTRPDQRVITQSTACGSHTQITCGFMMFKIVVKKSGGLTPLGVANTRWVGKICILDQ